MTNALAKLDKATQMLSEAKSLDEVKNIMDIAEAARTYARAAKLGLDAQNHAAEICLIAKRKAGEFLGQLDRKESNQHVAKSNVGNSEYADAIEDAGITYQDANRWQQIATVPEEKFSEFIEHAKKIGKEITTNGVLKIAKEEHNRPEVKQAKMRSSSVNLYAGDMLDVLSKIDIKYDVVITDPPYNVTDWKWDKFNTPQAFLDTTEEWLSAIIPHLNDKYCIFWFCSPSYAADIEMVLRKLKLPIQSRLVWHRRNMAKGSDAKYKFVDSWEMIFHCGNKELNFPANWDASRFDVQTFAVPQTNFTDTKYHPTQKPEELIKWLVEYGSFEGDKILDPFGGSGTTGAVSLGRDCDLIEMNEEYLSVIEQRLNVKRL